METETINWTEFSSGGKTTAVQRQGLESRNESAQVWASHLGIGLGKLTIWGGSMAIESYNKVYQNVLMKL